MPINRRELVVLTAAACIGGCNSEIDEANAPVSRGPRTVNLGPVDRFAADGVYDDFRSVGCIIVRHQGELIAFSSVCTHRNCTLNATRDKRSLYCKCHGSRFDELGHVTKGPAKRDLPRFDTEVNAANDLLVKISL